ncbi:MAG TPA: efflux RND transporter periplasmic adaptor subunit [Bryobacteraceae bacterium]|nr:efflux RND transporter periplasmic adaptor subunit [Bryobacteraceae bacterium]
MRRTAVPVTRVEHRDLSTTIELAADFRPFLEIDLHAKVSGYVKSISVDIGDRVRAGQPVAVLEVPELNDDLVHAAAQVERDRAEVSRAADELRRTESAYAAAHAAYSRLAEVVKTRPNLVAQQELDDALAKDRVGQAQVSAAQAALESAKQQVQVALAAQSRLKTVYAYSRISAPFAGVITKRYADPGAMIQAGTASQTQAMPLVTLADAGRLRLIVPVPESAVSRVRIGSPVAVRVPALNRTFEGKVARFTGQVQASTRTMDTEVDVPNPRFELVPGMYAYATLTLERRPGVLAIPVQAVSGLESSSPSVLVVSPNNVLEQRAIRLGIEAPSEVEVISGLSENELIVAANPGRYRPGEEVAPKPLELAARSGEEVR